MMFNRASIAGLGPAGVLGVLLVAGGAMLGMQPANPAQPATTPAPKPTQPSPTGVAPPAAPAKPETPASEKPTEKPSPYVLGHRVTDIDGKEVDLAQWKGSVILIVNTASKCGYTPQYLGLQNLYAENKDKGLIVVGFPSGDFMNQEFADNAEIKKFCTADDSKYKVTFPLMAKVSVKGEGAHPLFKQLAAQPAPVGGEPKWNFTKWLVDRSGNVVARYDTRIKPDDLDLQKRVSELLGSK